MASRLVSGVLVIIFLLSVFSSDSTSTVPRSLFSFVTEDELVVMDGKVEIAREDVAYEYRYGGMVWSLDGRHVSLISTGGAGVESRDAELISVDAHTGEVLRSSCAFCHSLAPIGSSSLIVTRNVQESLSIDGLLRFDLGSGDPPVSLAVQEEFLLGYANMRVFAGSMNYVMAIGMEQEGDGYFSIDSDGHAQEMDFGQPLPVEHQVEGVAQQALVRGVGDVAAVYEDNDQIAFAVTSVIKPSEAGCPGSYAVSIVKPESGLVVETDISGLHHPDGTPAIDGYARVLDLWWGNNGQLHAVMLSGSCEQFPENPPIPPSVWRLDGGQWQKVEERTDRVVGMRHLDEETRLVIIDPEDEATLAGSLYIEYGEDRHLLSENVLQVEISGFRQCEVMVDDWCGGEEDLTYGSPQDSAATSNPSDSSALPSPPQSDVQCSTSDFVEHVEAMDHLVGYEDIQAICRGGYAYVGVQGEGPMVHEGSQDLLFSGSPGSWTLIGGGPGSFGQFLGTDIEGLGLDSHTIDELFPEMDLNL